MVSVPSDSWCPVEFPPQYLDDDAKAPFEVPSAPPRVYAVLLAKLLEGAQVPATALNSVLAVGTITIYGARQFVGEAQRLLTTPKPGSPEAETIVHELIVCASILVREAPTGYGIRQVGELLASTRKLPAGTRPLRHTHRPRGLLAALEKALAPVNPTRSMDAERYARFLVRMDEFYDDSMHQLCRLADLASRPLEEARALFGDFLVLLHRDYVRGSFEDNLSRAPTEDPEASAPGDGLVELLPEVARMLR